ncbi:MAG: HAD family hydrolase [Roseiflexaceae bacterium]
MIRAVIFDRDNTLLSFDDRATAQIEARIQLLAPELPTTAMEEVWNTWLGPWPRHPDDEPSFWQAFCGVLIERHGLLAERAPALCQILALYHTTFAPYGDVNACLLALHRAGLRLGILTNFELPSVDRTLTHAGIDPALFSAMLSSGMLGFRKPEPRAYYAIVTALGEEPAACAFIDDEPQHVAAARQLGMRAFQIDRSRTTHDLEAGILCSLEPLPRLLTAPV